MTLWRVGWRESHSGGAREAQDAAAAAEGWVAQSLSALGLTLAVLEKVALVWWLRGRATISLAWLTERPGPGHYPRVSQAVSRINRQARRMLRRVREGLPARRAGENPGLTKCHNYRTDPNGVRA